MHLVEHARNMMVRVGAEWVLWLLFALSVASIAVIIERVLALRPLHCDLELMRVALRDSLKEGGFARARVVMAAYDHPAAFVVMRGMDEPERDTTPEQAENAMAAEAIAQRHKLEARSGFLATLGANAPFIGLTGTVIGILQAFDAMSGAGPASTASAIVPQAVMSSIAEALVATAVGIGVAIPAVFAFNNVQRMVSSAGAGTRMLQLEVLSYLHGCRTDAESPDAGLESGRAAA